MISTMVFMNVYLLFIILLGFGFIRYWIPFVLSSYLFCLADAEFPPEKVELFDKYYMWVNCINYSYCFIYFRYFNDYI